MRSRSCCLLRFCLFRSVYPMSTYIQANISGTINITIEAVVVTIFRIPATFQNHLIRVQLNIFIFPHTNFDHIPYFYLRQTHVHFLTHPNLYPSIFVNLINFNLCHPYVLGNGLYQIMVNQSQATLLEKTYSPFPSSYQLLIAPYLMTDLTIYLPS